MIRHKSKIFLATALSALMLPAWRLMSRIR